MVHTWWIYNWVLKIFVGGAFMVDQELGVENTGGWCIHGLLRAGW